MSRRIIFVDLDRTLFDTNQFMPAVWQAIGQLYPRVNVDHEISQISEWYEVIGDLKHYLFPDHFAHATGARLADAIPALRQHLQRESFVFPDADAIKKWPAYGYEVRILSFGAAEFQEFKLSLMPEFDEPRDIILSSKGEFIANNFPDTHGFMIDDKRNNDLPSAIREVWLRRDGAVGAQDDGIITIHSLKEVEELL